MTGLVDVDGAPLVAPHAAAADAADLMKALAKAYTDVFAMSRPRPEVRIALKAELDIIPPEVVRTHLANLSAIVTARSLGGRCGDVISQEQLTLLKDALAQ